MVRGRSSFSVPAKNYKTARGQMSFEFPANKTARGQMSFEFLAIITLILTYIVASVGLWSFGMGSINDVSTRNTASRIAGSLEFYAEAYSHTKGKRTIKLSLMPQTRAAIVSDPNDETRIFVRSCSTGAGDAFSEEIVQLSYPVRSTLSPLGSDCASYPLGSDSSAFIVKHVSGRNYVEVVLAS